MNYEADHAAELNEEKSNDKKNEVKVVGESSRPFSFRKKMKGLSPYRRFLKDQMMDKTVLYVDLL
jgi:hypothetical protein